MAFNEFFTEMILPFLLVFVVVFAILQKSKILGEDKRQIDSLVALVIGLLVIGVPMTRNFISGFIPWLAVGLAVLLVFFILYGFAAGDLLSEGKMPKHLKYGIGALAALFIIAVLLWMTGFGTTIVDFLSIGDEEGVMNLIIILIVIAGAAWVVFGGKGDSSGSGKK